MKKEDKIVKTVRKILEELLSKTGIKSESEIKIFEGVIFINIKTKDPGVLIGWHGNTLSALQHILRLLMACKTGEKDFIPIVLDVEGYKQKQRESLEQLAVAQALEVKKTGKSIEFAPMASYKRKIIHLALANFDDIATESIGEGAERRVVIKPAIVETQKVREGAKRKAATTKTQKKGKTAAAKVQKEAKMQKKRKK
jgi:spoIIIJ-associated protein